MRLVRALIICGSCSATTLICLAWLQSLIGPVIVVWTANQRPYQVLIGRSTIVFISYDQNQPEKKLPAWRMGQYESKAEFEAFKQTPWYHGGNSWWERVGATVEARWRFAGIEAVRGTFWPAFNQPITPMRMLQLPLWLCLLVAASPTVYQVIRWRKLLLGSLRSLVDSENIADQGETQGKIEAVREKRVCHPVRPRSRIVTCNSQPPPVLLLAPTSL